MRRIQSHEHSVLSIPVKEFHFDVTAMPVDE